ncbi:MAG: ATP-binding protein [Balneolaceae bacterium]|nr:ATP-binding protein [Balneolaceae bacterium]
MALTVKSKILLTVLSVVLMFTFFILIYFPSKQEQSLLENYNEEIENFANSVALGVKIALTEQNFEGVETAIDFVRDDKRLQFVSIIQTDTVWHESGDSYEVKKSVFRTFPEGVEVDVSAKSNDSYIYKSAPFSTPIMTGEVMLSFSTQEIVTSMEQIRLASILASLVVFGIGLGIGYLLAKNISRPVLALRDAAKRVGEGDLSQSVRSTSKDEIGELTVAFNKMVRELNIEDALEKIRNRTIAMQGSEEWSDVIKVFFEQMNQLGFNNLAYRLVCHDPQTSKLHYWVYRTDTKEYEKHFVSEGDPAFLEMLLEADEKQQDYAINEISAEQKDNYAKVMFSQLNMDATANNQDNPRLVVSTVFTGQGALEVIGRDALPAEEEELLQRLARVIDQSYTRLLDLKKSEAQALEATKQAALDRIRGEVASMRSKDDLNKITPLVWRELKTLKVPFIRCGVFIVDEEDESILSFLSTPDGKALGFFTMNIDDTSLTANLFKAWKKEINYFEHWDKEQFLRWTNRLIELGHVESQEKYQGAVTPPENLDLHFVPFKQGMLYVGNEAPLSSDHLELVEALATVFSIAFARYEDFIQLEKAKNEVEKTLAELRSTQSQLVLSEKMASLGELTAGIAHEIQNPLNFVNNFSDLSTELIDELDELIQQEKHEEVASLAEHLKQNLQKINHHGNRASSIVQGMLEHSRESSSQKELTNINTIADEYVRLAYHGYRAKDKSFQAEFETELDDSIPEIKIISQDISRVLLNLINNAFYAVSEKAKMIDKEYQPCVKIRTAMVDNHVEIRIKDNGGGIPDEVVDKIFQPFFTTKPTGKGTGLGLSISYDIVTKGHNGKMSVVTHTDEDNRGESGTEFIVSLPVR